MELETFSFYQSLSTQNRQFLQSVLKPIAIPKSSVLFFQGDYCQDILILQKGEVRLYLQGDDADIITLYHLHPGEQCIVNTSSAISTSTAIATAETLSDIEGWLLPKESAKTLMMQSEDYRNFIFSLFTIKLSSLAEIIEDIKFTRLEDRLLKTLKKTGKSKITTTHEALAIELGSSRVVISRILKKLESENKVTLHRGMIELLNHTVK
ncbi:MAG: Crp/Fnr family transcriptional regulator [Epsilonproteobacteria bacterium]|nr:Crp/Fnr family transcriptional regulator [Campylobacterota bacterium]